MKLLTSKIYRSYEGYNIIKVKYNILTINNIYYAIMNRMIISINNRLIIIGASGQ